MKNLLTHIVLFTRNCCHYFIIDFSLGAYLRIAMRLAIITSLWRGVSCALFHLGFEQSWPEAIQRPQDFSFVYLLLKRENRSFFKKRKFFVVGRFWRFCHPYFMLREWIKLQRLLSSFLLVVASIHSLLYTIVDTSFHPRSKFTFYIILKKWKCKKKKSYNEGKKSPKWYKII